MEVVTGTQQQAKAHRTWVKPPPGWITINVDAACRPEEGIVGMGCVARDATYPFIRSRSNVMNRELQPRETEALSLEVALS